LDLRAFLANVRAEGELQKISGAHWNLEIGALTELFAEKTPAPAEKARIISNWTEARSFTTGTGATHGIKLRYVFPSSTLWRFNKFNALH
jgi:hypothetical protein